eukprot:UN31574
MIGEMNLINGEISATKDEKFLVSQEHFIENDTLRNNIIMNKRFDKDIYKEVIECVSLKQDLKTLIDGDQTEIGAKGINLSGGQKARVCLARAIYHGFIDNFEQCSIYLLDDILSAVDPDVGDEIFTNCIRTKLKGCTRILVLNSHLHNLKYCDNIIVMDHGVIVDQGNFEFIERTYPDLTGHLLETADFALTPQDTI